MIKNLLYSLFFHLLLLAAIYFSFNIQDLKKEDNVIEVEVSVAAMPVAEFREDEPETKVEEAKIEESKKEEIEQPKKEEVSKPKESKKDEKDKSELKKKEEVKKEEVRKSEESKKDEKGKPELKKEEVKKDEIRKPEEPKIDEKSKSELKKKEEVKSAKTQGESAKYVKLNVKNTDISKSLDNVKLLSREKLNIKYQLMTCYKRALEESKRKSDIKVMVKIFIDRDGIIYNNLSELIDLSRYNEKNSQYKIAIDNMRRTFELCTPLRNLPADKYDVWKELVVEFENKAIARKP